MFNGAYVVVYWVLFHFHCTIQFNNFLQSMINLQCVCDDCSFKFFSSAFHHARISLQNNITLFFKRISTVKYRLSDYVCALHFICVSQCYIFSSPDQLGTWVDMCEMLRYFVPIFHVLVTYDYHDYVVFPSQIQTWFLTYASTYVVLFLFIYVHFYT